MKRKILRCDIYWADLLKLPNSSIIHGYRPVIIVSNNQSNAYSPLVTIVPLTSKEKRHLPTHIELDGFGLQKVSIVLTEQLLSIDKSYLRDYIGTIDDLSVMQKIDECIKLQLAG